MTYKYITPCDRVVRDFCLKEEDMETLQEITLILLDMFAALL